jgi:predicted SAM-dependent methyltransferase
MGAEYTADELLVTDWIAGRRVNCSTRPQPSGVVGSVHSGCSTAECLFNCCYQFRSDTNSYRILTRCRGGSLACCMGRIVQKDLTIPKGLNLGCGPNAPPGWLNVDGSWNAWFSNHRVLRKVLETVRVIDPNRGAQWKVRPLVHDLTKPLPFGENSFSSVYASHVLEHLYLVEAQRLLSECKRVLRAGGVIRMVVPDLRTMVTAYLESKNGGGPTRSEKSTAADKLNEMLAFRSPTPPNGSLLYKLYALSKDFHHHKWMYDSDSLVRYLRDAGFAAVSERGYLQSEIPDIEEVEEAHRVLDGAGVCVEARKP